MASPRARALFVLPATFVGGIVLAVTGVGIPTTAAFVVLGTVAVWRLVVAGLLVRQVPDPSSTWISSATGQQALMATCWLAAAGLLAAEWVHQGQSSWFVGFLLAVVVVVGPRPERPQTVDRREGEDGPSVLV